MAERRTRGADPFEDARANAHMVLRIIRGAEWPTDRFRADPVGFANIILGVGLWSFQVEFLEAIRDHRHVACAGGRKLGKDFVVAIAALWWYCSWPKAKVFILAPTATQLDEILYLEIRQLLDGSGRCLDCKKSDPEGPTPCDHSTFITGEVSLSARTGIRAKDFRRIFGKTAARPGNMRGFSGAKVLAIEDEASDIKDEIDSALLGNLASADCHRAILSNPDKPYGFFFRAFHEERDLYHHIQQSSEETPNAIEGREIIPGLASREWLKERERAWGRGSPLWQANVEGKFPKSAEGQLFALETIKNATAPDRLVKAVRVGRLQIGVDVAGEENTGDETAIAARRGDVPLSLYTKRDMTPEAILVHVLGELAKHRTPKDWGEDECPIVVVDRDGIVGARAYDVFVAYRQRDDRCASEFHLIGFRGGEPPRGRLKETYKINRDLGFAGLVEWVKAGGCLIEDLKLEGELVALRWAPAELGKSTLEHKSKMRERLGRSPDRADATMLSVWRPEGFAVPAGDVPSSYEAPPIDPYTAPNPYT